MCCIFHKPYQCILSHKYTIHSLEVHQHRDHACYKATGLHLDKLLKANREKYIIIIPHQSICKKSWFLEAVENNARKSARFSLFFLTDKVTYV